MQVGPVARSLDICLAVAGCSTMAMQCSGGPMPPSKAKYIPKETFELRDFSHFLSSLGIVKLVGVKAAAR